MTDGSEIANRIHQRRMELGLSMRELARRTGLSASFISQVERGKVSVSVDSLQRIAKQLNVSILYFLSKQAQPTYNSPTSQSVPTNEIDISPQEYTPVVRENARPRLTLPASGLTYELLTNDLNRKMEPIFERLEPGAGKAARQLREPTEEMIFMLSGALLVGLKSGEHILYAGDSIYFEGSDLVKLVCASETEDAVWIAVLTPPVL